MELEFNSWLLGRKTEIHYRQKKLHLLETDKCTNMTYSRNANIWRAVKCFSIRLLQKQRSKGGNFSQMGESTRETFWLHVKNNFLILGAIGFVRRESESLVTGGVQIQAPRLLSENAEDEFSSITWDIELKWALKTSFPDVLWIPGPLRVYPW